MCIGLPHTKTRPPSNLQSYKMLQLLIFYILQKYNL